MNHPREHDEKTASVQNYELRPKKDKKKNFLYCRSFRKIKFSYKVSLYLGFKASPMKGGWFASN